MRFLILAAALLPTVAVAVPMTYDAGGICTWDACDLLGLSYGERFSGSLTVDWDAVEFSPGATFDPTPAIQEWAFHFPTLSLTSQESEWSTPGGTWGSEPGRFDMLFYAKNDWVNIWSGGFWVPYDGDPSQLRGSMWIDVMGLCAIISSPSCDAEWEEPPMTNLQIVPAPAPLPTSLVLTLSGIAGLVFVSALGRMGECGSWRS